MEQYIQISKINDFLFSPRSLYLHSVYEDFDVDLYHDIPQTVGKISHRAIEEGRYSTAKRYLQSLEVYSAEYMIAGKIDVYDKEEKILIERKTKIKEIYLGYRYQLYAQYFCMKEGGYGVGRLLFHSLADNKRYEIELPGEKEKREFKDLIHKMLDFDISQDDTSKSKNFCETSIYKNLSY